jgi:hypothetical protein
VHRAGIEQAIQNPATVRAGIALDYICFEGNRAEVSHHALSIAPSSTLAKNSNFLDRVGSDTCI